MGLVSLVQLQLQSVHRYEVVAATEKSYPVWKQARRVMSDLAEGQKI